MMDETVMKIIVEPEPKRDWLRTAIIATVILWAVAQTLTLVNQLVVLFGVDR